MVLNLISSALVATSRLKICEISIYQTSFVLFKRWSKGRIKNCFQVTFCKLKTHLNKEPRSTIKLKKCSTLIPGAVAAGSTSELAEGQITKLLQLTSTNIRKETKIIVKLLFLTQKCVLTNNQRALSNSKNVLTLIQGALVGWVFPKMGERSIY